MPDSVVSGSWTYRSFRNNPELVGDDPQKALELIFGEGKLDITFNDGRIFKASLDFGGGAGMDLFGAIYQGAGLNPKVLVITGTGREGTATAKWVYQYQGYIVPDWAEGVDQRRAIVGTVIRTIPHNGGRAGVVASFVMVQHP
jgi:hypothetical protein